MVQLNLALREINCKVVYFGCGLGGKTTNLEIVHEKAATESRGELTSIATESDRTLFFDFMPLDLGTVNGMRVKFQLYTVPGQVYYNSTRKLVLRGADGVIFVADSQRSKIDENVESLDNLEDNLKEQGRKLSDMPHVIQFNKRDMDEICTVAELSEKLNRYGAQVFEAVASKGDGVLETFKALAGQMLERVKSMSTESAAKPTVHAQRVTDPAPARSSSTSQIPTSPEAQQRLQGGIASTPVVPIQAVRVESRPLERSGQPARSQGPAAANPAGAADATEEPAARRGPAPMEPAAPARSAAPAPSSRSAASAATVERPRPSVRERRQVTTSQVSVSPITTSSLRVVGGMMVSTSSRRRRKGGALKIAMGIAALMLAAGAAYYFFM